MALVKCPECGHKVWSGAATCPSCAYPIDARWDTTGESYPTPTPLPAPRPKSWVHSAPVQSSYFALKQIVTRLVTAGVLFASGAEFEAPPVIIVSLLMGASVIPIWWRARRTAIRGGSSPDLLPDRIEELERELEDRQLRQMEEFQDRHAQHLAELEERLDFAERMLTRQDDNA